MILTHHPFFFSHLILTYESFNFRSDCNTWFIYFQMWFFYLFHLFSCDSYKWLMYFQMWFLHFIHFQMWFLHMNHSFSWFLRMISFLHLILTRYSFYFQMRFLQMIHLFFSQIIHFSHMILTHDPLMTYESQHHSCEKPEWTAAFPNPSTNLKLFSAQSSSADFLCLRLRLCWLEPQGL